MARVVSAHRSFRLARVGGAVRMVALLAGFILTACASSGDSGSGTTVAPPPAGTCGSAASPPRTYEHVVLLLEENRTWSGGRTPAVGMGFGGGQMPFLHSLATTCSYFTDWAETDGAQDSLSQYIGLTSGVANPSTVEDCSPSPTCQSTDDNLFRQVRNSGGTARTFVEGATEPCSEGSNRAKHIPALYYKGGDDASHCAEEVRPLAELDPNDLPTLAFIVPDLCHDGHDCADSVVDEWAAKILTPILSGLDYRAGTTLIVIVYDEDQPVPNLLIAPTANRPAITSPVGSHASLLRTVEEVLGLPMLAQGQMPEADSLRDAAHI